MTPNTLQLQRNLPLRTVNQAKGNPFLSLRAIPFLIVLVSSLAIQPALGAQPVVKTIQVASFGACGIVASPNRSEVYVACTPKGGGIEVIDTVTNELSFHIATAASATGIGISPDGKTLYGAETEELVEFGVWHPPQGFLEAISLTTFKQLFLVPLPSFDPLILGVASNGSTVYVPDETTGNVGIEQSMKTTTKEVRTLRQGLASFGVGALCCVAAYAADAVKSLSTKTAL